MFSYNYISKLHNWLSLRRRAMNCCTPYSSPSHLESGPMLWYIYLLSPFDCAGHLKHVLFPFQEAVNLNVSLCHSQSPRNSHRINLRFCAVNGVPARSRSDPTSALPPTPVKGLTPSKHQLNDHTSRRHTQFSVLFLTINAWGQLKSKNLECLTDFGLKWRTFIQIATTFSNLYCVQSLAASPWMPSGIWLQVAGLDSAQGSFIDLWWAQKCCTSDSAICNFTSLNR